jgi:hypothetical protein
MMIGVFALGLGLSAACLVDEILRVRAGVRHVPRVSPEIHLVAAMISGVGAGLAWGSLWGLVVFIGHAFAGMFAAIKLRA